MQDIAETIRARDAYIAREIHLSAKQRERARKTRERESRIATVRPVKVKGWKVTKAQRIKQVMKSLGKHEKNQEAQARQRAKRRALPFYVLGERLKAKWEGVTVDQVLAKFGPSPTCYLTGLPIDYANGLTYHLEHIHPRAKGGASTLDNMQLAHPMANLFKGTYQVEEFIRLCHLVARKHPLPV